MKSEVMAVLLTAIVVSGVGFSSLALTGNKVVPTAPSIPSGVSVPPNGVCGNQEAYVGSQRVMLMSPGTSGVVCLAFLVNSNQQEQFNQTIQQAGGVYLLGRVQLSAASGVKVSILSIVSNRYSETVEYSFSAPQGADGAYDWVVPGTCPGLPLVVGSSVSGESSTLTSYYSQTFNCPAILFGVEVIGTSNMTVQSFPTGAILAP